MLSERFYAQALTGLGTGFAGTGFVIPYVNYPLLLGTGGGMVTGENQGIGLAFTMGLAQPVFIEGSPDPASGLVTNAGIVATYVKAI